MNVTDVNARSVIAAAQKAGKVVSMADAKKAPAAGLVFQSPTGVFGVCTGELSGHKKPTAFLTCAEVTDGAECTNVHLREISDWHQSSRCLVHSKKRSKGGPKLSDDPQVRALQEQEKAVRLATKKAERETKVQARLAEVKAKRLADMQAKLDAAQKLAKEKGVSLSPQLLAELDNG